jgi:hypothetical protein
MSSILTRIAKKTPIVKDWVRTQEARAHSKSFPATFEGEDAEILSQIRDNGYYVLPDYVDGAKCDAIREAFLDIEKNYPQYTRHREDVRIFGGENICAETKAFYDDPYLQRLSDAYYGCETMINVLLANHVAEIEGDNLGSGGDWHRDRYARQFKSILYVSDVAADNGPFEVIKGSNTNNEQTVANDMRIIGHKPYETRFTHESLEPLIAQYPNRHIQFTAKKGTVILVDTSAIHRGCPLEKGDRFALFNYYIPKREFKPEIVEQKYAPLLPANYKNK